jgi:putative DNA primase/helicase
MSHQDDINTTADSPADRARQASLQSPECPSTPALSALKRSAGPDDLRVPEQAEADQRPQVCLVMKRLPEAVATAQEALAQYNKPPTLFMQGDALIKLRICDQGIAIAPITTTHLQSELTYAARWFEQTDKGIKATYPPALLAHTLFHRAMSWAPLLQEVVHVPIFGANWRLLLEPGYHSVDQIYYHPDHGGLPPVPETPTADELDAAKRLICEELLGEFPFVNGSHRAAAVAALIVPFVRQRIDGATPLHLFDSPQPGSGKTLLADAVAIPALGREPAANTEIANGDDLRKWVTAMAMAGERVVMIDNINARLRGAALAAALTAVEWRDRIVGTSRLAKGSVRCLWLATGNNVMMTPELARRVVRCRIDAGVPQPHLRGGFTHPDLRAWAKANRAPLIWAALTLVRHWVAQGRPDGSTLLGSYESYCRIVGGILCAADIGEFLGDLSAEQHRCDDETTEWLAFVTAWYEHFGNSEVGAEGLDKEVLAPNPEMLSLALCGTSSQRGRRIKLGQELRKRRDSVLGGHRLRVSDGVDRHGCWRYRLESCEGQLPPRSPQPRKST